MSVDISHSQGDTPDGTAERAPERGLALDALYRKYSEALRRFLVRRGVKRDEVADIVQETYCRVLKSGELETIRHPRAFLFQVGEQRRAQRGQASAKCR